MKPAKNSNIMKSSGKAVLKSKFPENPNLKKLLRVRSILKDLLWHKLLNLVKSPAIKEIRQNLKNK